ncbi:MAG TPA: hypothetical protein VGM92_11565 [Candidatus Kapabacteria bacterium]
MRDKNALVKILIIFALLCFAVTGRLRAQTDTARWRHIEYVVGASAGFSLLDYVGHNLLRSTKGEHITDSWYYDLEAGIQIAISYFLYRTCGLSSAISFNLIWWTWGDDLGYYGWAMLINPSSDGHRWENRSWNGWDNALGSGINWAGWTPVGLLRPQRSAIAESTLLAQAIIGFSVSIGLLW